MKAVLIDFDGTLADSIPLLFNTYNKFLASHGKEGNLREFQELNGPKMEQFIHTLQKRYQIAGNTADLCRDYREQLEETFLKEVLPFPDAFGTVFKWDQEGRQLGIVTAAHLHLVEAFLAEHFSNIPFVITTGDEVNRSKPDPAIYRLALEKLFLGPEDAVAVEDSFNGIKAAEGAGLKTFTFKNSWSAVHEWVKKNG